MSFAKIRPRRGTANQWSNANPILAEGEIGIEVPSTGVGTGTVKIKFGDGSSHWNDLPYGLDTPNDVTDVISSEFIAGTSCTSGNYYIANNKLYKCIADTDGSINVTNSNYFTNTTVSEELSSVSEKIDTQLGSLVVDAGVSEGKEVRTITFNKQFPKIPSVVFTPLKLHDNTSAINYQRTCIITEITTTYCKFREVAHSFGDNKFIDGVDTVYWIAVCV